MLKKLAEFLDKVRAFSPRILSLLGLIYLYLCRVMRDGSFFFSKRYALIIYNIHRWRVRRYIKGIFWISDNSLMIKDLDILCKNKEFADKFDALFDKIAKSKSDISKSLFDMYKIHLPIIISYALLKSGFIDDVSILGVPAKYMRGVDEVVIVISSTLSLFYIPLTRASARYEKIINYYAEKRCLKEISYFIKIAYMPLDSFAPYMTSNLNLFRPGRGKTILAINMIILIAPLLVVALFAFFYRYVIVYDIYVDRNLGYLSIFTVIMFVYVELCSLISKLFLEIPLPYRNIETLVELDDMMRSNPGAWKQRQRALFGRLWAHKRLLRRRGYLS